MGCRYTDVALGALRWVFGSHGAIESNLPADATAVMVSDRGDTIRILWHSSEWSDDPADFGEFEVELTEKPFAHLHAEINAALSDDVKPLFDQ